MTQKIKTVVDTPQQASVARTIASVLNRSDERHIDELNHLVERIGETVILISAYLAYRLDDMRSELNGMNSAFTQRLANRTTTVIRERDNLERVLRTYIQGDEKRQAYGYFSEIVFQHIDSLLDDMHRDYPEPTAQVMRRAKLRYHDPYPAHVKECTAAFEDGYCKGYIDAMDDFIREVAALADNPNIQVNVRMQDGKIKITPA